MDIKSIRSSMHKFEEAVFLGMEFDVGGIPVLLAGAAKEGKRVQLYFYAAGKDTAKAQEQNMEIEKQRQKGVLTKREELLWQLEGQGLDFDLMGMLRGIKIAGIDIGSSPGTAVGWKNIIWKAGRWSTNSCAIRCPLGFWNRQIYPTYSMRCSV